MWGAINAPNETINSVFITLIFKFTNWIWPPRRLKIFNIMWRVIPGIALKRKKIINPCFVSLSLTRDSVTERHIPGSHRHRSNASCWWLPHSIQPHAESHVPADVYFIRELRYRSSSPVRLRLQSTGVILPRRCGILSLQDARRHSQRLRNGEADILDRRSLLALQFRLVEDSGVLHVEEKALMLMPLYRI